MDWQELAYKFQSQDDWSGLTYKDLREVLEGGIANMLFSNDGSAERELALSVCREQIDWVLYVTNPGSLFDTSSLSVAEFVKRDENAQFDSQSKSHCYVFYLNTFLYKFINMELNNLRAIINNNDALTTKEAIEYFITILVYPYHAKDNPGVFFTFRNVQEGSMQPGRVQNLENLADELYTAYRNNDELQMFKTTFFVMTNFAGAKYRPIHRVLTSLFRFNDLGEFRSIFYENLPNIIKNKGAVNLKGFTLS